MLTNTGCGFNKKGKGNQETWRLDKNLKARMSPDKLSASKQFPSTVLDPDVFKHVGRVFACVNRRFEHLKNFFTFHDK